MGDDRRDRENDRFSNKERASTASSLDRPWISGTIKGRSNSIVTGPGKSLRFIFKTPGRVYPLFLNEKKNKIKNFQKKFQNIFQNFFLILKIFSKIFFENFFRGFISAHIGLFN